MDCSTCQARRIRGRGPSVGGGGFKSSNNFENHRSLPKMLLAQCNNHAKNLSISNLAPPPPHLEMFPTCCL